MTTILFTRRAVMADDHAAFHHERDTFEQTNILGGIALDGDDVGESSRLERTDAVGPSEERSRGEGGRLDRFDWRHAPFDHLGKLLRVVAVRVDAGIGAEDQAVTGLIGTPEI